MAHNLKLISNIPKLIKSGCWAICCGYCFLNFIAEPIICSGPSMEPVIKDKNIIIIEHISTYFTRNINRGDIIVSRSPNDPKTLICKRVVGIAGDSTNGTIVPRGNVWLLGDNLNNSIDSREFGPVPVGLIIGKAVLKIWPLRNIALLVNHKYEKKLSM